MVSANDGVRSPEVEIARCLIWSCKQSCIADPISDRHLLPESEAGDCIKDWAPKRPRRAVRGERTEAEAWHSTLRDCMFRVA